MRWHFRSFMTAFLFFTMVRFAPRTVITVFLRDFQARNKATQAVQTLITVKRA